MKAILSKYDMWGRIGLLKTGDIMSMPLKPEWEGKPCLNAPYPLSKYKQNLMDTFLDALEKDGVIEDSEASNFSSPCLIVIQKGKPRFVVDYRKVNARCIPDPYPLPRQEDVMNAVEGAVYISLFDIQKAFFQLPIRREDRPKTTFVTPHRGAKQFTRALMGYLGSPGFCQRQMDKILAKYKWEFCVCYVDDIVVFSKDWASHLRHVDLVLKAIFEAGLTIDPAKAYVGFNSLKLLGHLVSRFGLSVQQDKIQAMLGLAEPTTLGELDRALGFFGYYRSFIESYAQIAFPLTEKLKGVNRGDVKHQKTPIVLDDECKAAFAKLKEKLRHSSMRAHAKTAANSNYALYVDACAIGFGAALHLIETIKGKRKELPVVFISRSLKTNEKQYWPTEMELAGLVWAMNRLEPIIEGHPLTIYTDHMALKWLFSITANKSRFNQRLLLWSLSLQKWRPFVTIVHRPGRSHINADVLSRFPVASEFPQHLRQDTNISMAPDPHRRSSRVNSISVVELSNSFKSKVLKGYKEDCHLKGTYCKLVDSPSNHYHAFRLDPDSKLLYFRDISKVEKPWRLVIPENCVKELLKWAHDDQGHQGTDKTYDRLAHVYIPRLAKRIQSYVGSCPNCLSNKPKRTKDGLLNPIVSPSECFHTIAMDFISGFPESKSKKYNSILTISDKFTKVVTLVPTHTSDDAKKTAERFFRHFYLQYGLPKAIISDRDTRFVSSFWKALAKRLDTKLLMSTAYHPQTDGASERTNQTVENILRSMIGYGIDEDWVGKLKEIEFCINTATHSSTGTSPFEVLYGYKPRLVGSLLESSHEQNDNDDWLKKRDVLRKEVSDAIADAASTMARFYDVSRKNVSFQPGDKVLIRNRQGLVIPGMRNDKLGARFFGPFEVLQKVGATAYKLNLPDSYRMHDVINIQHLKKAPNDEYHRTAPPAPPLATDADEEWEEYEVEKVIDKRVRRGKTQYLAKFKDYPVSDSIWYDREESSGFSDLVKDYESRLKEGTVVQRDPKSSRSTRRSKQVTFDE